ncbi:MAG TPA: N-acetylglucosamine-6-phosphate deacetylase [Candidatus Lumbricidophila sp.]|nr:N-acetylglucosamine-6-phosphate deacetylase [Candidatus Lumbricidophila sp.]
MQTADSWLRFEHGVIVARGTGRSWAVLGEPTDRVIDLAGAMVTPGFIDIHCHGAGGHAFDDGEAALDQAIAVHTSHGTTRIIASLVTASVASLEARLEAIGSVAARDLRLLGAHLEGPFLDNEFRGAHDPALLRTADPATLDALLAASGGWLRQVTLAPELPEATAAISRLVSAGVRVAVGHTSADYDTAARAFDAGASILTHAFNGMRGIHHRAPGPVVAAMRDDAVTLELINDGVHVHPSVVRMAFDAAPGRVALVTDAMAAAGSADGRYILGTLEVDVRAGVARLVDGGSIAGSTLTMDAALRQSVGVCGIDLPTAVAALTEVPARAIGREDDLGKLDVGYQADLVVLDGALQVTQVWVAGTPLN